MDINEYIQKMKPYSPQDYMEYISARNKGEVKSIGKIRVLRNEIKPADLFCYLGARFGPPNGIQTLLRSDDSDNLIHWDWTLEVDGVFATFTGMNYRSELHFHGGDPLGELANDELAKIIKSDFKKYGDKISAVRKHLEHWDEFVNPYKRVSDSISSLEYELQSLNLDLDSDKIPDISSTTDLVKMNNQWNELGAKYAKGYGLCFGIRSMLPVKAEAFINLLIFVLARQDVKGDKRIYDSFVRQQIDVRVKSLHLHCNGFNKPADYGELSEFHTLMNNRNDLLHGNVAVEKLKFNELYFLGKMPIFKEYTSMWDRAHGIMARNIGLDVYTYEMMVVESFESYIKSLLQPPVAEHLERFLELRELGIEKTTKRIGCLFSNVLTDWNTAAE